MIAAAIIVFVLVIAIPVGVLMSGSAAAGILGWFLRGDVEERYEGSEYVDLGR